MAANDLHDYGLAVTGYRALLRLRVRLCPPGDRERLGDAMVAEVRSAVVEEVLRDLDYDDDQDGHD